MTHFLSLIFSRLWPRIGRKMIFLTEKLTSSRFCLGSKNKRLRRKKFSFDQWCIIEWGLKVEKTEEKERSIFFLKVTLLRKKMSLVSNRLWNCSSLFSSYQEERARACVGACECVGVCESECVCESMDWRNIGYWFYKRSLIKSFALQEKKVGSLKRKEEFLNLKKRNNTARRWEHQKLGKISPSSDCQWRTSLKTKCFNQNCDRNCSFEVIGKQI